jgi:hypothetical protein
MIEMKKSILEDGHLSRKRVEIRVGRRVDETLGGTVEGIGVLVVSKLPATGEITVSATGIVSLDSGAEAGALAEAFHDAMRFVISAP